MFGGQADFGKQRTRNFPVQFIILGHQNTFAVENKRIFANGLLFFYFIQIIVQRGLKQRLDNKSVNARLPCFFLYLAVIGRRNHHNMRRRTVSVSDFTGYFNTIFPGKSPICKNNLIVIAFLMLFLNHLQCGLSVQGTLRMNADGLQCSQRVFTKHLVIIYHQRSPGGNINFLLRQNRRLHIKRHMKCASLFLPAFHLN